jgi:hypothetical protein
LTDGVVEIPSGKGKAAKHKCPGRERRPLPLVREPAGPAQVLFGESPLLFRAEFLKGLDPLPFQVSEHGDHRVYVLFFDRPDEVLDRRREVSILDPVNEALGEPCASRAAPRIGAKVLRLRVDPSARLSVVSWHG